MVGLETNFFFYSLVRIEMEKADKIGTSQNRPALLLAAGVVVVFLTVPHQPKTSLGRKDLLPHYSFPGFHREHKSQIVPKKTKRKQNDEEKNAHRHSGGPEAEVRVSPKSRERCLKLIRYRVRGSKRCGDFGSPPKKNAGGAELQYLAAVCVPATSSTICV